VVGLLDSQSIRAIIFTPFFVGPELDTCFARHKISVFQIGICTGGPGVFLGHPYPYPRKTVPGHSGMGNYGHGHRDHSGSHVPKGISGYRFSSHVFWFMIKNNM
jgi:hypothetical protein